MLNPWTSLVTQSPYTLCRAFCRPSTLQEFPTIELPVVWLQLMLAAVAAVITAVLFSPTLRFVRSYWLHTNPPYWSTDYIGGSKLGKVAMHLHLLLPLVAALLWVSRA